MTPHSILQAFRGKIPAKDLRLILQKTLGFSAIDFVIQTKKALSETEIDLINKVIKRRLEGVPVARLFNEWEFWGLTFELSEATLIPRPDTETLIEAVLNEVKTPKTILDLGTGSGCILISLLKEYSGASGVGIDISEGALQTAQRNAARHHLTARATFICGNWAEAIQGTFDLIVANPLYIETAVIKTLSTEVQNYDPILALDGGDDGLASYRLILSGIKNLLGPGGLAFFEIGYDQANKMMKLVEEYGFSTKQISLDLGGHPRVIQFSNGDNVKKNESQG